MSREYTLDEVRDLFLKQVVSYVHYWEHESRRPDVRGKLEGLAFSILVILDGGTDIPSFKVTPAPHPTDKAYCKENDENWYPNKGDIAGGLHELLHKFLPPRSEIK